MVTLAQVLFLLSLVLLATPAAVYRRIQSPSFWFFFTASLLSGIAWWLATYELGFYIPEIIAEMFLNGEYIGEFYIRQMFISNAVIPLILYLIFTALGLCYLVKKKTTAASPI